MKEIKNLKGETVRVEPSEDNTRWRLSVSTWILLAGLIFFNIGCFVRPMFLDGVLQALDVRLWPWEVILFLFVIAGILFQCGRIRRGWSDYYDYEKKHAWNFIALSVTVLILLVFLFTLSLTGRFFLFFRPVVNWFARGHYTLSAVGRSALIVISLVPLIYFGKEWICGFWDE